MNSTEGTAARPNEPNMLAALWRYRWAVVLPVIAGAVIGFLVYLRTPETFRSTTRLMVQSERPAMLDSMTGDVLGGVPSIDIVRSQLYSDNVLKTAFGLERMAPFRKLFEGGTSEFIADARGSLILQPEVEDLRSAESLVTLLHYEGPNPEFCRVAVESFSDSLRTFFNQEQKDSKSELIRLMRTATERLHPKMLTLEQRYRDFRLDAPLAWNSKGEAINPHREHQFALVERRGELTEELRLASIELAAVESISKHSEKDALLRLRIIGQLLDRRFEIPNSSEKLADLREADFQLATIELDQSLVPLIIQRNKYASDFGENHPMVKGLDSELVTMKNELKRLLREETSRILELTTKREQERIDPQAQAAEAIATVIYAIKSQVGLLERQIADVSEQIANERAEAIKIARFEQENAAQLREIERTRELLNQFEEQMARVSLIEDDGSTRVVELTAPTEAYKVGPSLSKSVGFGTALGALAGVVLALLLEKNANTFRDSDEIGEYLGTQILTHLPFFKGRVRKQKGEVNPFKDLDPSLCVLHAPASVAAEAIRSCRTSLFFATARIRGGKIIQVTSPLPGDGKSTISGNLAASIAQSGKRVLAIDADLRRPQLSDNFACEDKLGLSSVLNGTCEVEEACHPSPLANLHVMPSGPIPANPAEALTLQEMSDLLTLLRERYDYIVVDTPPLLVVTDPSIIASMVDGVVLGLRVRRKSKPNARESCNILRSVDAKLLGVVVNNSDDAAANDGYRGYGYYRYGRYTSRYYRPSAEVAKRSLDPSSKEVSPMYVSGRGPAGFGEAARSGDSADLAAADTLQPEKIDSGSHPR